MRYIVRPRTGVESLTVPTLAPLFDALLKFGPVNRVNYLSSFSVEVDNDRLGQWRDFVPALQEQHNVVVRLARVLHAIEPPADPEPTVPASLKNLELEALWNLKITGANVQVGVIDEGFLPTHASIKNAVKSHQYYDFAKKGFVNGGFPRNTALEQKHGTFAAALIAGEPINNVRISVAPDADLHLVELPGVKFEDDFCQGLEYLAVQKKCRVISISLGSWEPLPWLDQALDKARSDGALPVVAIGNDGMGVAMWPGACARSLSVGYCDENGGLNTRSGSTRLQRKLNPLVPLVIAPGVMLTSADVKGASCQLSGSSFAAPLVAGLAALLISDCTMGTSEQLEDAIVKSCKTSASYKDRCAYGMPTGLGALTLWRAITGC